MKVIVLGAGSIIGQYMRLSAPAGIEATWVRTRKWADDNGRVWFYACDLTQGPAGGPDPRDLFLRAFAPDVVINLAGVNCPDTVQWHQQRSQAVNVEVPAWLSWWCENNGAHYVHVSSDQVFGGALPKEMRDDPNSQPPYRPGSPRLPANLYGAKKLQAEVQIGAAGSRWTIVRPGLVLGVRPMPLIGRENPIERWMRATGPFAEVSDRYCSPVFAWDVAAKFWEIAQGEPLRKAVHVAVPVRVSRYELAQRLRTDLEVSPVSQDGVYGAPMAEDTSFADLECAASDLANGLDRCVAEYSSRNSIDMAQRWRRRACEFAIYGDEAIGLGPTGGFLSEHLDKCAAIAARLKAEGVTEALCLGDGIGDLSIALGKAGIHGVYHDIKDSSAAQFAEFRQQLYLGTCDMACTREGESLIPVAPGSMEAIVAVDWLERVQDRDVWLAAIQDRLKPGGWLYADGGWSQKAAVEVAKSD